MWFTFDYRKQVASQNPSINCTEISTKLSEKWKSMTPGERSVYQEKARQDWDRFNEEIKMEADQNGGKRLPTLNEVKKLAQTQNSSIKTEAAAGEPAQERSRKKPLSGYFLYAAQRRKKLCGEVGIKFGEITQKIAAEWRSLSLSERHQWQN